MVRRERLYRPDVRYDSVHVYWEGRLIDGTVVQRVFHYSYEKFLAGIMTTGVAKGHDWILCDSWDRDVLGRSTGKSDFDSRVYVTLVADDVEQWFDNVATPAAALGCDNLRNLRHISPRVLVVERRDDCVGRALRPPDAQCTPHE